MKSQFTLALLLVTGTAEAITTPTPIKLYFIEALAPRDTTSSERFQKDYEAAIEAGKSLIFGKLGRCGYQLETKTAFYDASDPLQAKEKGQKAVEDGAWLVIGPRRSNHYLLLAQGAGDTPSVSIMATASEVGALGKLHLSLSATNSQMAEIAAREAKARLKKGAKTYVSVVSSDCLACKDFAKHFDARAGQLGLKKLAELEVIGEAPETAAITDQIKALAPSFVLVPNYSKLSSYLISTIRSATQGPFFVGSDGWGDANFGFIQNNPQVFGAQGFAVRGLPPLEDGLKEFEVGRALLKKSDAAGAPYSGPALAILKALDSTATLLCKSRPRTAAAFRKEFEKSGARLFASPWGVSVYSLSGPSLQFDRTYRIQ